MQLLLTDRSWRRAGDRLPASVEVVRMLDDGTFADAGSRPVRRADVQPDVIWATADLFDTGAPLRPFFAFIASSQSVRWVQSPAAGIDAPVFGALLGRGVRLTTSHVTDIPIAEYVLRAVLDVFQDAARWRANQLEHGWARHDFRELAGSRWLVVGVGAIGGAVAIRARAFGAHVTGCRRHPDGNEPVDDMIGPAELTALLGHVDVLVLSAPATAETTKLVDDAFLRRMRPDSVLVNVARGALVDETALLAALDRGAPGTAVLDVTAQEPLPADHPLWSHPRVVLTPHNSAGGMGRHARHTELFLDNLSRFREGHPLRYEVTAT